MLNQIVDAIIRLGIVLVLLIQQRQTELSLEVTRHQNQKVLIIKTGKVIAQKLFVNECPVEEACDIGIVEEQHLIQVILGITPLFQLDIPRSLLQAQIDAVRMIGKHTRSCRQGIAQRLVLSLGIAQCYIINLRISRQIVLLGKQRCSQQTTYI